MAKSEAAAKRMFDNVYICMKCNARNRFRKPEGKNCRKCGYSGLRPKHREIQTSG